MMRANSAKIGIAVVACCVSAAFALALAGSAAGTDAAAAADSSVPLVAAHEALGLTVDGCASDEAAGIDEPGYYDKNASVCTTASREYCMTCHESDWEDTVAATADYDGHEGYNPHDSHMGAVDCGICHSLHGEQTLYCVTCHTNYSAPEGWN